jgi:uncharacterized membrane protein YhdT
MEQNRFKSWMLWTSIAALVVYVVKLTTGFDAGPIWDELADLLLPVLVGLGVINNPTSKTTL